MAAALKPLLPTRRSASGSSAAFASLDGLMALDHGTPSGRAAEIVLKTAGYVGAAPVA